MSNGQKRFARVVIGILVGLIGASTVGISFSNYLITTAISLGAAIVVGVIYMILMKAVHGGYNETAMASLVVSTSFVVDYFRGWTFWQCIVVTLFAACSLMASELCFPTDLKEI